LFIQTADAFDIAKTTCLFYTQFQPVALQNIQVNSIVWLAAFSAKLSVSEL